MRAFVRFSATQRASLIGLQEWKARGPAAMLAADLGAPVLDPQALQVLTAEDALAALPDTTSTIPASSSDGITIGLQFKPWVRVDDAEYLGMIAVMTDGMRRFGLPELRMGHASPDLREELTTLLNGVAFRVWSGLIARAQDNPNAAGLLNLPRFLRVPAEMDIHRRTSSGFHRVDATNRGGPNAKGESDVRTDHSYDSLLGDTAPAVPDDEVATPHSTRCQARAEGSHGDPSVGGTGPGRDAEPLRVPK